MARKTQHLRRAFLGRRSSSSYGEDNSNRTPVRSRSVRRLTTKDEGVLYTVKVTERPPKKASKFSSRLNKLFQRHGAEQTQDTTTGSNDDVEEPPPPQSDTPDEPPTPQQYTIRKINNVSDVVICCIYFSLTLIYNIILLL